MRFWLSFPHAQMAEDAFYQVGFMSEADDFRLMVAPGMILLLITI